MTAKPKTSVPPHPFQPDPDQGTALDGRQVCHGCNLLGRPDDAHHTMPDVPEQADVRRRYEPGGEG